MLDADATPKTFWKYIKVKEQDTMNIGTMKENVNIADTPGEKADMLNEQFTSVKINANLSHLGREHM